VALLVEMLTDTQILLLSQIEVNVAIISASVPALRPLLRNTSLDFSQREAYGSGYRRTVSSGSTINGRSDHNLIEFSGQISLLSMERRRPVIERKTSCGRGMNRRSEDSDLKDDGITRTTETTIEFEQMPTDTLPPSRRWMTTRRLNGTQ